MVIAALFMYQPTLLISSGLSIIFHTIPIALKKNGVREFPTPFYMPVIAPKIYVAGKPIDT